MSNTIVITNDFYPRVTTNAKLLTDVVREFSEKHGMVVVYCSRPKYYKRRLGTGGLSEKIKIKRFWNPELQKSNVVGRVVNSFFVCAGIFVDLVFFSPNSIILVDTTSPFQGPCVWLSSKIRRHKYIYLATEFYPDAAVALGFLKENSLITRLWDWFNKRVYRSAFKVIVIGERLRNKVSRHMLEGINDTSLVVIHNWADIDKISPIKPEKNSFRRDLGLQDKLVISYSGNLGLSHDLSTLLTAANMLKTDETVAFLIIGEGPQKAIIKTDVEKFNLTNVTLLPYQPDDVLPLSLSAGDFSVVTLNREMDKLTIPSKLYPAMAAGQAIIAIFTKDTDIADIVIENNAGIVIEQGDSENFVREISKLNKNRELIKAMKNNARQTVVSKYSRDISVNRYCELLLECSKVDSYS